MNGRSGRPHIADRPSAASTTVISRYFLEFEQELPRYLSQS
jgi:hypothetical protein